MQREYEEALEAVLGSRRIGWTEARDGLRDFLSHRGAMEALKAVREERLPRFGYEIRGRDVAYFKRTEAEKARALAARRKPALESPYSPHVRFSQRVLRQGRIGAAIDELSVLAGTPTSMLEAYYARVGLGHLGVDLERARLGARWRDGEDPETHVPEVLEMKRALGDYDVHHELKVRYMEALRSRDGH